MPMQAKPVPVRRPRRPRARTTNPSVTVPLGMDEPLDPWVDYDPEQARAAILKAAGALNGVDCEALKRDIREQREQWPRDRDE